MYLSDAKLVVRVLGMEQEVRFSFVGVLDPSGLPFADAGQFRRVTLRKHRECRKLAHLN